MRAAIEQGNRVYLRAPRESDRDEFVRLARASRKLHRPWVYAPETARQYDSYLVRARAASERCFLVVASDDESLVVGSLPAGDLGETRRRLLARSSVPVLLVRAGLRPGGLAPERTLTRFSWSLRDA